MTDALSRVIASRRTRWNARFAEARAGQGAGARTAVAGDELLEVLREELAPIVQQIGTADPTIADEPLANAADALYEAILALLAGEHLGPRARVPAFVPGFGNLFRAGGVPGFVARAPAIVAPLTNALHQVTQTPGARPEHWIDAVGASATHARDVAELLDAGAVAAWRAGLPRLRPAALAICARLLAANPVLLGAALDLNAPASAPVIDRLTADPWAAIAPLPEPQLEVVARAGAFRAFGGLFLRPPRVAVRGDDLLVLDGDATWQLCADATNATFHRVAPDPSAAPSVHGWNLSHDGHVTHQPSARRARFRELVGTPCFAGTASTLAVVLPRSHTVALVALRA